MSLKKQIRDLKLEQQKKDEELEQHRKTIRVTKVTELEAEIKAYKALVYEFIRGVIEGSLDKFGLTAEIVFNENS